MVGTHILAHARARAQVVVGGDGEGKEGNKGRRMEGRMEGRIYRGVELWCARLVPYIVWYEYVVVWFFFFLGLLTFGLECCAVRCGAVRLLPWDV